MFEIGPKFAFILILSDVEGQADFSFDRHLRKGFPYNTWKSIINIKNVFSLPIHNHNYTELNVVLQI
jgi:hypothetical protein